MTVAAPPTLEWTERIAPLGMRFVDAATGATVAEGLEVWAARGQVRTRALANRTGAYSFARLAPVPDLPAAAPDADAAALDRADDAFWASPPVVDEFTFEFDDALGRYLPGSFTIDAPHAGLAWLPCQSPPAPDALPAIPLYAAPARVPPSGFGVVRARLWDHDADLPAAWAVLEAAAPPAPATSRGVAGPDGDVVVLVPYPEPPVLGGSPPGGAQLPVSAQRWALELTMRYDRIARG